MRAPKRDGARIIPQHTARPLMRDACCTSGASVARASVPLAPEDPLRCAARWWGSFPRRPTNHETETTTTMTPDTFTDAHVRTIVDALARDFDVTPLRAHECIVAVPGEPPRRLLRRALVDELRGDGLDSLARRIDRACIPRGHALVVGISSGGVTVFVTAVNPNGRTPYDTHDEADALVTRSASAVGVLGALAGGSAR